MRELMHLPSTEGNGDYDLYALAPEGMSAEQAKTRVNNEIHRANAEYMRNSMNRCDDGLTAKDSLMTVLAKEGFEFITPTVTQWWDEIPV